MKHPLLFDFTVGLVRALHVLNPLNLEGSRNRHSGSEILAASHRSPNDIRALIEANKQNGNRRTIMMSKDAYWEKRLARLVFNTFDVIPINRENTAPSSLKRAKEVLRNNHPEDLGVFLEGGIKKREGVDDAKGGVAMLALQFGTPVRPVGIVCVSEDPSKLSISRSNVYYGELIDPTYLNNTGLSKNAKREELTEIIRLEVDKAHRTATEMSE